MLSLSLCWIDPYFTRDFHSFSSVYHIYFIFFIVVLPLSAPKISTEEQYLGLMKSCATLTRGTFDR